MCFRAKFFHLTMLLVWPFMVAAEVSFDPPQSWLRARTLQPGQQIWGFRSSYQTIKDRFSNAGKIQPLGQTYDRTVTWGQLLNSASTVQERAELEALMPDGAKSGDVVANATYEVQREEVGFRAEWAYGLMRGWMIGFNVPVVRRQTRVRTVVDLAGNMVGAPDQAVKQKIRSASEQELSNSGFDDIPDQEEDWVWGDATLLSQIAIINKYNLQMSVQQFVTIPTSRNPELDNYLSSTSDSGQVDLGVAALIDWRERRWILGSQLGYVMQLPDRMRARISKSDEARRVDPDVARDLGDWYFAAADADYHLYNRVNLNVEYSYLRKFQDRFAGANDAGFDYSRLAQGTDQELHQTRVGMRYELASDGARAGIESKWVAGLGYTYPWIGRNSANAAKTSVDLISYF